MDPGAMAWQRSKYLAGFAGDVSSIPADPDRLKLAAKNVMTPKAYAYVEGAAGMEETKVDNERMFSSVKIVPRMLRNIESRDTSTTIFGRKIPSPLILSPVGVLELAHRSADLGVARAAAKASLPMIFSNQASFPMEEMAGVMGENPRWFQLYWSKSDQLVRSFISRAESCGCGAIVVTLDTTLLGWRTRDLDLGYLPFLEGKGIAQYTSDPVFQKIIDDFIPGDTPRRELSWQAVSGLISMVNHYPGRGFFRKLRSGRPVKAVQTFIGTYSNPRTTWNDLKFLRGLTKLPIVLKGILHPADAKMAIDEGMDGIIISNHGGRQVDGAISTFEALPAIVSAVPKDFPVLLDGGIRGGADVFKALALGAKAVCVGRPYVYGLALGGQHGAYEVLRNLMADFELTMGLAGCADVKTITKEFLSNQL
jgi:lactate 2-monooxygenase